MKRQRNAWAIFALCSSSGLGFSGTAAADVVAEFAPVDEASRPTPTLPAPPAATPPAETAAPSRAPEFQRSDAAADTRSPLVSPASAPAAVRAEAVSVEADEPLGSGAAPRPFVTSAPPDGLRDSAPSEEANSDAHYVSLTFSAARAFASLYEVTTEVALGRHFGVAALLGFGSLDVKHPSYSQTIPLEGRELGGQARVYVIGGFDHGLMLGGELLRVWAEARPTRVTDPSVVTINGTSYSGTAMLEGEGTLTGVGAYVGYKLITKFGLTFDAKLGWQRLTLSGNGTLRGQTVIAGQTVQQSESASIHESRDVPLFNLNLGWSI